MKYRITPHLGDPNSIRIHVDQRLIRGANLLFEYPEQDSKQLGEAFEREAINKDNLLSFCHAVTELDGVDQRIFFLRYMIQLSKGDLFTWESILPGVLVALQTFIARDGVLEEDGSSSNSSTTNASKTSLSPSTENCDA